MSIHSIVSAKLLTTNAHLGRRVCADHFKAYVSGSRNGMVMIDSDKTLICLRNALDFIGSTIRQKGCPFFLKTNHLFFDEMLEEMVRSVSDSRWKIGSELTSSHAMPRKLRRSTKKKVNFGLVEQPDCVVVLDPEGKPSVIREAYRRLIPVVSLVPSTLPLESYERITYPIPANCTSEFVYLFLNSIAKTAILSSQSKEGRTLARKQPSLPLQKLSSWQPSSST